MTNTKKITIALLLCAMLAPTFASCGGGETVDTAGDGTNTTADAVETETEAEETRAMHRVPESDFGGAGFHTLYPDWQGYKFYFFADEATGDAMNDAIYDRKIRVEEYTNTKITEENGGGIDNMEGKVKKTVQAGEDVYQQVLLHCISGVSNLASGGFLYDYAALPNVDLSAEWWNQSATEQLRLGKKTLYAVSDYMIPCPYVIVFNKDIVRDNEMENPYELVYAGEWTIDKYIAMAEAAVSDVDGDGKFTEADIFGMTSNESSKYIALMPAADQFITEKGDDGRIRLAMNTEKTFSLVEKVYAMSSKDGVVYRPKNMELITTDSMMMNGNVLFLMTAVSDIIGLRESEVDIGLLPYPKYDAAQEAYRNMDWGGLAGVPVSIQEPEMVGAVIELLAYESGGTVIPAYYDVLLAGKLARDEDSTKMLDILFDTITYEIGGNYFGFSAGFNDLFYTLGNYVVMNGNSDFASLYAKNEKSAQQTIDKFYTALDENDG